MEHLKGALFCYVAEEHTNNRLGWNGLPGTNALAYYEKL
jgi:hypothetical protein